jgi:TolB-like protein/Tfp pilus assembly protein PilF
LRINWKLEQSVAACETALALNPNADAYHRLALSKITLGEPEEALRLLERSFVLNPRIGNPARRHWMVGYAHLIAGDYEKAVAAIEKGKAADPTYPAQYWVLASALGWLGRKEEAQAALAAMKTHYGHHRPLDTIARMKAAHAGLAVFDKVIEGLRRAGMPEREAPEDKRPSVAVLPFRNATGDPSDALFVDGVTEDIVTDLSKLSGIFLISSTATGTFKNKTVDARDVAQTLGVRYVLTGSVRREGNALRITASLTDTKTNRQTWAQRYDRALDEKFAVQDDIAESVVRALELRLTKGERERLIRRHTENLEAHEAYLRGLATMLPPTPKNVQAARPMFERAIDLDPNFAGGYAGLSWIHSFMVRPTRLSSAPKADLDTAVALANKAIEIDSSMAKSWTALAGAQFRRGKVDDALTAIERALEVEPGYATAHMLHGMFLDYAGRPDDAIDAFETYFLMNPGAATGPQILGYARRNAGQFDKAIAALMKFEEQWGASLPLRLQLAAAYAQAGRLEDAESVVRKILAAAPSTTLAAAARIHPYQQTGDKDAFLGALRAAGLPEKASARPGDRPAP